MATAALAQAIERSAAPAAVGVAIERITEAHPQAHGAIAADDGLRDAVVAVTAASRSLTTLCVTDARALGVLGDLATRVEVGGADEEALARAKRLELLRIAARDLVGLDDVVAVCANLSALAAGVLRESTRLAGAAGLAVVGMGKLGAHELNYASDIDIVFVGSGPDQDPVARRVMDVARGCYRVDADLRPEGRDGPLVRSLEAYVAYWERWAEAWEFQALIKARPLAGDAALGKRFADAAQRHVWERAYDADDLRAIRAMKARAEAELARKGLTEREIKRGRGGIRDIEFTVQLLQLVHGGADAALRAPATIDALGELAAGGYVDPGDGRAFEAAYRFLRAVEHRLQLVDEQQVHAVPADASARLRLARVMGYRDQPQASALEQFEQDLRHHQSVSRSIHERVFFRPLLDALAGSGARVALSPEAAETRLAAFGFTDAERTRQAVRELTRGLSRSSRLMRQMLPLLLGWLADSPDPDLGVLGLRRVATGQQRTTELATAFRESPEAARRLCVVLGTSGLLGTVLEHNPDLVPALGDDATLGRRSYVELSAAATRALAWRGGTAERQPGLQRLKSREILRVAARDILGLDGDDANAVTATGSDLAAIAEVTLGAALSTIAPPVPFAVIAVGRFGGGELSYASDLDVLFVYEGSTPSEFADAERAAESLVRFLKGATPAARIYDIDLDLRPEGKDGPLARSLDGYRTYYERWAQTWERQALVRARPVAGDADLGRRFLDTLDPFVWRGVSPDEVRDIRRMKARIERERIPAGDDASFHLKLGPGSLSDVEFTTQLLQLESRTRGTSTLGALTELARAGRLDHDDMATLAQSYRFCERTRNRWYLIKGAPGDSLPRQPEMLSRLARSLDTTPSALREQYRRVTRRARQVVQRLFYGVDA